MRRPILTNKVLRGLQTVVSNPAIVEEFCGLHDQSLVRQGLASTEQMEDAQRAREWVAAMVEWWRSTHKGVKL